MPVALITGASAGIGLEFARQLAPTHDLVLVARNVEKLDQIGAELFSAHATRIEVLGADVATRTGREPVLARLSDPERPIDLLINNAGMGYSTGASQNPVDDEMYMLEVNAVAKVHFSLTALRAMLARNNGGIINVSSVCGIAPAWTDSLYGTSTATVLRHTEEMAYSKALRASDVKIMALCPGDVKTEFNDRAGIPNKTDWGWVDVSLLVRVALADLRKGKVVSVPTARYKFLSSLMKLAPNNWSKMYAFDLGQQNPDRPDTAHASASTA
ncbi:SDR family NAD(P)-dependent oxidoreductase [Streptomyces sp. NBC_01264]|uniref:SDR family NAD(P)-dependent oxidoreductase n=1 Tax=Streptomyces sp. NBC_01264 TaxID=2903804 RepID=UPI0022521643|nr:SDR family NAD(P)-dependent oxidoreductase [Streptomyces sp. NBC_01264]MCX4781830.1 SDR family NAD(P)-dependent oxidoreductase [Streptomyces sp. NBC_01264]